MGGLVPSQQLDKLFDLIRWHVQALGVVDHHLLNSIHVHIHASQCQHGVACMRRVVTGTGGCARITLWDLLEVSSSKAGLCFMAKYLPALTSVA
jgi:hypothetical protein